MGIHQDQPVLASGASLAEARVAMIMLHGRGASAESILSLADEFREPQVVYLAPQTADNTWYPNTFLAPLESNEPHLSSALAKVESVLSSISEAGIPPERTLLLGFSQGACLASEFAARNARRYGGLVALSGGLIGSEGTPRNYSGSLSGTPAFLGCSTSDPHIPKQRVELTAEVLAKLEANVTLRFYPNMGHTVNHDEIKFTGAIIRSLSVEKRSMNSTNSPHEMISIQPSDLKPLDLYRLFLSIVAPRPIAWVSSIGSDGSVNLAPFSYFNAVGSPPPVIMISIGQRKGVPKDTLRNLRETGEAVVHIVDEAHAEIMNSTSTEWQYGVNEFEQTGLTTIPSTDVKPPRIAEALAAMETKIFQFVPILSTGFTVVFAEVVRFHLRQGILRENGMVNPELLRPVTRLGGDEFSKLGEIFVMPRPKLS